MRWGYCRRRGRVLLMKFYNYLVTNITIYPTESLTKCLREYNQINKGQITMSKIRQENITKASRQMIYVIRPQYVTYIHDEVLQIFGD